MKIVRMKTTLLLLTMPRDQEIEGERKWFQEAKQSNAINCYFVFVVVGKMHFISTKQTYVIIIVDEPTEPMHVYSWYAGVITTDMKCFLPFAVCHAHLSIHIIILHQTSSCWSSIIFIRCLPVSQYITIYYLQHIYFFEIVQFYLTDPCALIPRCIMQTTHICSI